MSQPFGATPEEWAHFDFVLGLSEHLLPVVCDPDAKPSPRSTVKGPCRTPSLYNRQGELVGIKDWTKIRANGELKQWMREPDYGICLQTRELQRGLDLDIRRAWLADAVHGAIETFLGIKLPCRRRGGVSKRLLVVGVPGKIGKRRMSLGEGDQIEFLADGQMFVAVGSREDGSRYYWDDGLPYEIPTITMEQFENLWAMLEMAFAVEDSTISKPPGEGGGDIEADDPVAEWLAGQGLVLEERDRGLVVACPWEHEHTSGETGDGSTMWMLAGGRGHEQGHFRCLHGHCDGRTRQDYLGAVGYVENVAAEFPVMLREPPGGMGGDDDTPLPGFQRNRFGEIMATIGNVQRALEDGRLTGGVVSFDEFKGDILVGPGGDDGWRRLADEDYIRMRTSLESAGFKPVGKEMMADAVYAVAKANAFDSAIIWLETLVPAWDGKPRIETFLRDYLGVEDSKYSRGVSLYMWTAMAGRCLEPGVKADMAPILVGAQGTGKSSIVAAMAINPEAFGELSMHEKEDDMARRIKGKLVVELGELRGLRTKDLETIKAWLTRRWEEWIPKFREMATTYKRRCIFIGTTNEDQFLADKTGNRRWLPVVVKKIRLEAAEAAMLQLWAEARDRFKADGVLYGVERLAAAAHEMHMMTDPRVEVIRAWLGLDDELKGPGPLDKGFVTTTEILLGPLGMKATGPSARSEAMEVGNILRASFGLERKNVWINGRCVKGYARFEGGEGG